jgi:hypothetical protein
MTSHDFHDASAEPVRLLPLAPDPGRAERVRLRCRAELGQSRRRAARRAVIAGFTWHLLAPAVVGGFCVFYVVALVATTVTLQDVFR